MNPGWSPRSAIKKFLLEVVAAIANIVRKPVRWLCWSEQVLEYDLLGPLSFGPAQLVEHPPTVPNGEIVVEAEATGRTSAVIDYPDGVALEEIDDLDTAPMRLRASVGEYIMTARAAHLIHRSARMPQRGGQLGFHLHRVRFEGTGLAASAGGPLLVSAAFHNLLFFTTGPRDNPAPVRIAGRDWRFWLAGDYFEMEKIRRAAKDAEGLTAVVTTEIGAIGELEEVEACLYRFAELSSYANASDARPARIEVKSVDSRLVLLDLIDTEPTKHGTHQPIPTGIGQPGGLQAFLSEVYDNYLSAKTTYNLGAVMRLAQMARQEAIVNVKALLISNALEVLRYHYGHNVLVPSGQARLVDDDLHFLPAQNGGRRMSFAEILICLAWELGLTNSWSYDIRDLRNQVVHTGSVPGTTVLEMYRNCMRALHFVDCTILALLRYTGPYVPCHRRPGPGVFGQNIVPFVR